jgi:hypothetical protein
VPLRAGNEENDERQPSGMIVPEMHESAAEGLKLAFSTFFRFYPKSLKAAGEQSEPVAKVKALLRLHKRRRSAAKHGRNGETAISQTSVSTSSRKVPRLASTLQTPENLVLTFQNQFIL